jgi:hypothetical protein
MKKLLTIAALMGVASLSYGQGTVNFANGASAATHIGTNSTVGGASTGQIGGGANSYYFALFVAPVAAGTNFGLSTSLDPTGAGFTYVGLGGNTAALGRFNGNPDTNGTPVAGYGPGSSAEFVVVGWSANVGLDWNSFRNWAGAGMGGSGGPASGWAGHSLVADNVQLGGGLIPIGNIFGANTGQVPGFTMGLIVVPEPTTFALAGLGAAALVIFRRRKA